MSNTTHCLAGIAQTPKSLLKKSLMLTVGLSTLGLSSAAMAQTADDPVDDEIVVIGTRAVIQDAINLKRQSTSIVDGLSADEIGDIPALSIGEALETITGASSHRENGGATEISIRGLGPFLSSTTFNGREATNGSGDRSVNFSQFPAELMSKLAIYKTQDASLIEGGVAGLIALETLKPLDYNKRRFQFDIKGNYNPDQQNIEDSMAGDIGFRGTASYVDQIDFDNGGRLGFSIGGQISDISQPEQEIRSSSPTGSSRWACLINGNADLANDNQGFNEGASRDDDCEDDNTSSGDRLPNYRGTNDAYDTRIDPATGLAIDDGEQYVFAMSSRGFRQNDTSDKRNSLFGALQFQPNERWDINLDAQWSERTQAEDRYDLYFNNSRRNTRDLEGAFGFDSTVESLLTDGAGEALQIAYESEVTTGGEIFERKEIYTGVGFDVGYEVSDRLSARLDLSYSETTRTEFQQTLQVQSGGRAPVLYTISDNVPSYSLLDFDVLDINNFDDDIRVRVDTDVDRKNTVTAGRLDFNYDTSNNKFADSVEFGGRYSELTYKNLAGQRDTFTLSDGDDSIYACETAFAESDFLSSVRNGDLITNVGDANQVIGSSNSWATFDNACLSDLIRGGAALEYPDLIEEASGTTDVTEKTIAGYIKANYEGNWGTTPVRGNYGVRVINTSVDSVGYRDGYTIDTDANGSLVLNVDGDVIEKAVGGDSYTEILPSFNFVADLNQDLLFRGGIFRGLSRADPSDMSFSRRFAGVNADPGEIISDPEDLLIVTAGGNPSFKPLTSWNFDAALEWYANEDSLFAFGVYYKNFKGGFENAETTENYTIDGQSVTLPLVISSTNQENSGLLGFEMTGTHRFSYLPGLLSGLGAKVSYNYATSDFEFNDSNYGDRGVRLESGDFNQTHVGLIAPGGIPGLSNHVLSAQVYWQRGNFDIAGYYKYRSQYFQPFTSNGSRLRYVGSNGVFEARASYQITDNFKLTLEGLNLFDEPRVDYFYQDNNFGQSSVYGPRVFLGLRGKF